MHGKPFERLELFEMNAKLAKCLCKEYLYWAVMYWDCSYLRMGVAVEREVLRDSQCEAERGWQSDGSQPRGA